MSFRGRLLVRVLLALLPAFAIFAYWAREQQRLAAEEVQAGALRLARLAASQLEDVIEHAHRLFRTLETFPQVRDGDAATCSRFLAEGRARRVSS